jgi:hypothetical protein
MARDVKLQPLVMMEEVLGLVNKAVVDARKPVVQQESFRRLICYLEDLQPIVTQLQNVMMPVDHDDLPPGIQVGLDGIKTELQTFQQTLHLCKSRSRLYLLIHCHIVVESIQETTHAIGQWLSLIAAPACTFHSMDLGVKTEELACEMLQAQFFVCEFSIL